MRILAISDIHGCALTLRQLIEQIHLETDDKLIFLGDYLNRGPRSRQVIDYIMELQNKGYEVIPIRGNHEDIALDSINRIDWSVGMAETNNSFEVEHLNQIDEKYKNWLDNLPYYYELDDYIFVHAGFNFLGPDAYSDINAMLWIRNWYPDLDYDWLDNRIIVHGHSPIDRESMESMLTNLNQNQVIDIDNGCFFKEQEGYGHLACLDLTNRSLIFQKNID